MRPVLSSRCHILQELLHPCRRCLLARRPEHEGTSLLGQSLTRNSTMRLQLVVVWWWITFSARYTGRIRFNHFSAVSTLTPFIKVQKLSMASSWNTTTFF